MRRKTMAQTFDDLAAKALKLRTYLLTTNSGEKRLDPVEEIEKGEGHLDPLAEQEFLSGLAYLELAERAFRRADIQQTRGRADSQNRGLLS
jgi:hypothetical protein